MKLFYHVILFLQWVSMLGGFLAAPVLAYYNPPYALDSLTVALLALACLKLDVVSLAR